MKTAKKHVTHDISGFELIDYLLQNVYKYNLTHVEKHVLFQLARCYNPKNKYIFPKQKTIALKINASERSVVRAIQSLVKAGLIIVECNISNRYAFTSKILAEVAQNQKNFSNEIMSYDEEIISQDSDTMSGTYIEPIKEQIKKPTVVENYKILKEYAIQHNAISIPAYINDLKKKGVAADIIREYREKEGVLKYWDNQAAKTTELVQEYNNMQSEPPTESWKELKQKLIC